jgi:hypothetical protein
VTQGLGEHRGDGGGARALAVLVALVTAWWLTARDAAAAGGSEAASDASTWTMWLVAGPMVIAAVYVWRSVLVDLSSSAPASPAATAEPAVARGASPGDEARPAPAAKAATSAASTTGARDEDPPRHESAPASVSPARRDESAADEPAPPTATPPPSMTGVAAPSSASAPPVSTPPVSAQPISEDDASADAPVPSTPVVGVSREPTGASPPPRPHTHRIGDTSVAKDVALYAAAKLLGSSAHGAVVFSPDASDEANAVLDRIAEQIHATRYVAGTGPNIATAERLAAEGDAGRRALHEMELALAIAGRGVDVVLFADERGEFGELTLRSLGAMDSICLADAPSPTSAASRVLLCFDGEPARTHTLQQLLDLVTAARTTASGSPGAGTSAPTPAPATTQHEADAATAP